MSYRMYLIYDINKVLRHWSLKLKNTVETTDQRKIHSAIILAAGNASRCAAMSASGFKFMLPLPDMPIGFKLISQLKKKGVNQVTIVTSQADKNKYSAFLETFFSGVKIDFTIVVQDIPRGPGDAFRIGLNASKKFQPETLCLILADTLINDNLPDLDDDVIVVDTAVARTNQWCWAEFSPDTRMITDFIDKQVPPLSSPYYHGAVCGVYNFASFSDIFDAASKIEIASSESEIQITPILKSYMKHRKLRIQETQEWLDFGSIKNYQESYKSCITSNKEINKIIYEDGWVTKFYPKDKEKVSAEVEWFNVIGVDNPVSVKTKALSPTSYSLEYISLPNLGYLYHFLPLKDADCQYILEQTIDLADKHIWSRITSPVSSEDKRKACYKMYVSKTVNRLKDWPKFERYRKMPSIEVNGKKFPKLDEMLSFIDSCKETLLSKHQWCFIHGDLNFSNIFYAAQTGHIKVIDPRGSFGGLNSLQGGDKRYELAKLRHSYNGGYELFVGGHYTLSQVKENCFNLNFPKREGAIDLMDQVISEHAPLSDVRLLEGLLYLSMVPLHQGREGRDDALFLRGIELVSDVMQA